MNLLLRKSPLRSISNKISSPIEIYITFIPQREGLLLGVNINHLLCSVILIDIVVYEYLAFNR
jgi:hypothetical protein